LKIVLGLGNPGARYLRTRHNLGFRVLDLLAERVGVSFARSEETGGVCLSAETVISGEEVVLAKPRTYMNRSGRAGTVLMERYRVAPSDFVVVHDDADLVLGRVRVRAGGSAGGHNGLRSLITAFLSTEFLRVKLGVRGAGRAEAELMDYVLEEFEDGEREAADLLVVVGANAVDSVLKDGLLAAMNRFNGPRAVAETEDPC
jgi:peptidyl-tRNA hydrolase, PTH1 family